MRVFELLGVAAQAQGLYLHRKSASAARSVAYFAAAGTLALAGLIFAHIALATWLAQHYADVVSIGLVGLGDLMVAGIFVLAARQRDPIAAEARSLRQRLLRAAESEFSPAGRGRQLASYAVPLLPAISTFIAQRFRRRRTMRSPP